MRFEIIDIDDNEWQALDFLLEDVERGNQNPLLEGSLPKEMNEKLAVFRTHAISESIVYDSIEDIANEKKVGDTDA